VGLSFPATLANSGEDSKVSLTGWKLVRLNPEGVKAVVDPLLRGQCLVPDQGTKIVHLYLGISHLLRPLVPAEIGRNLLFPAMTYVNLRHSEIYRFAGTYN
jgi:hypothetical protein